jgi:hypothetical protein
VFRVDFSLPQRIFIQSQILQRCHAASRQFDLVDSG